MKSNLMWRKAVIYGLLAVLTGGVVAKSAHAAPPALYVSGNKIDAGGGVVTLRGVDISALENTNTGGTSSSTSESQYLIDYVNKALNTFHANIIRLPLCQDRWEGKAPTDPWGASNNASEYISIVDSIVNQCSNAGVYVILDDHWSDMGTWGANLSQHNFCDWNSNQFWSDVATHYANNPDVVFDLYNEPHDVSWNVWKNGGTVNEYYNNTNYTYSSPGLQYLVNTIRGVGAKNMIIAGGLDWAYDLTGVQNGYALSDSSGNGIAYDVHLYYYGPNDTSGKNNTSDWDTYCKQTAQNYPVFCGEFGVYSPPSNESAASWMSGTVIPYINQNFVGGTAWACDDGDNTSGYFASWLLDLNDNVTDPGSAVQNWCGTSGSSLPTPHSGNWMIQAANTSGGWSSFYQTATVNPNTNYTLSWYSLGSGSFYVQALNSSWVSLGGGGYSPGSSSSWGWQSLSFNSGSNSTIIIDFADSAAGGNYFIDDVYCEDSNYNNVLSNSDFEQGASQSSWSVNSPYGIVDPTNGGPPAPPTGLKATAGAAGTKLITLFWTGSTGAKYYSIYRGTSSGDEAARPIAIGVTGTSYTNSSLVAGKTYYYKVTAVSSSGSSGLSNEAKATAR